MALLKELLQPLPEESEASKLPRETHEFRKLIEIAELTDQQKAFLRARWLRSITRLERLADQHRLSYRVLRITVIVGSLIVPALVSINVPNAAPSGYVGTIDVWSVIKWLTFCLSLVIAIASGLDGFMQYLERWTHYRAVAEKLKAVGWQYFNLSGPFAEFTDLGSANKAFIKQVEAIHESDLQTFFARLTRADKSTSSVKSDNK